MAAEAYSADAICPQRKQGLDKPCVMGWVCKVKGRCWNEMALALVATEQAKTV